MTIREAVESDFRDVAQLSRCFLGYACSDETVRTGLAQIDSKRERVFVAVNNETVIGFIHAEEYRTLYFDLLVNILGVAVSDAYRRMGVGTKLLSAAESWGKEIGAVGVRLNSGGTRHEAHLFYRSNGYLDEKTQLRFMKRF